MKRLLSWVTLMGCLATASTAGAQTIQCSPVNAGNLTPWAEGACALDHSQNPESWVRGFANFNPTTSMLEVRLVLETDSTTSGPCGTISAILRDAQGAVLANAALSSEICLGGKPPGRAVRRDFIRSVSVPASVSSRAAAIEVSVNRTRNVGGLWGVSFQEMAEIARLILSVAAAR